MSASGINSALQKETNLKQILKLIYSNDNCSRTMLASKLKLTQAAMTKLVNELLENGLVEETASINTGVGRKPRYLSLNANRFMILSGRLNRDYIMTGLYDFRGSLLHSLNQPISADSPPHTVLSAFTEMFRKLIAKASAPILGVGIALPGPFNFKTGKITMMSGFPGWEQVNIRTELSRALDLPVFLEHDANCGALAELWCGRHPSRNMIYITGDRGVGAGIVIKGDIYRGMTGYAGEFGHMSINISGPRCECGNRGCLELYGSTRALENEYQKALFAQSSDEKKDLSQMTSGHICELVRQGDPLAQSVYAGVIRFLAFGAVGLINILNPDLVIFADKITEGGDFFLKTVNDTLKSYLLPEIYESLNVAVSTLKKDPILLGASVLVFECILKESFENLFK